MFPRTLCWFSCGIPSAVAAKVTLETRPTGCVEVLYCDTSANEHPDNLRFLCDVEKWLGIKIKRLKSKAYPSMRVDEVWNKRGFFKNQFGAPCTMILKRDVRVDYQLDTDEHVFGFTKEEARRASDFAYLNADLETYFPLVERGLSAQDCIDIMQKAGIKVPTMYELGYKNNNCIGCVKGAMGYWNKIRKDFPERFAEMAKKEREIGYAICSTTVDGVKTPVFLDELNPERGNYHSEFSFDCGVTCPTHESP